MPKIKTNRAAKKRFKATKNGGIKRSRSFTGHLRTAKSPKRRRKLRQIKLLDKTDMKRVKRMLPYL